MHKVGLAAKDPKLNRMRRRGQASDESETDSICCHVDGFAFAPPAAIGASTCQASLLQLAPAPGTNHISTQQRMNHYHWYPYDLSNKACTSKSTPGAISLRDVVLLMHKGSEGRLCQV
jgi:hypothetical protein